MKSIAFLRKTWKKWAADRRDHDQVWHEPQTSTSPFSSIRVATLQQPKPFHSLSQSCDNRPILRRNTSRFTLDIACRAQGSPTTGSQSPIHDCDQLPRSSSQLSYSSTGATDHSQRSIPSLSCTLSPKDVQNSVPYHEYSPVYQMPQPLHASDGPKNASCYLADRHPYDSSNYAHSTDTISSMTSSDEIQYPQKMFRLDSIDAKSHTLYHRTRSMPYLPYEREIKSTCSVNSVDVREGKFPLFLFPTPPPLISKKKIPPPLVLYNSLAPASPQSSRDSTPVGTPTSPRFFSPRSPSQSVFGSCTRSYLGHRVASIPPPPFSPPNSPLPSPPVYCEDNGHPLDYARPPLRTAYSTSNLKDTLPFPATHRLTFNESISYQSSLPIKKSGKPRPEEMQLECLQACLGAEEQVSLTAVENNVQWGYAF